MGNSHSPSSIVLKLQFCTTLQIPNTTVTIPSFLKTINTMKFIRSFTAALLLSVPCRASYSGLNIRVTCDKPDEELTHFPLYGVDRDITVTNLLFKLRSHGEPAWIQTNASGTWRQYSPEISGRKKPFK